MYLAEVNESFGINLVEYNNFEAGERKTVLDTHFVHVSQKIIHWMHVGNDLDWRAVNKSLGGMTYVLLWTLLIGCFCH